MVLSERRRRADEGLFIDLGQYAFTESVMGFMCRLLSRRRWDIVSFAVWSGVADDGKPVGKSVCSESWHC
jgi:hypothetical protein